MKPIIYVSIFAFCALVLLVEHAQERADSFLYLQMDDSSVSVDDSSRFGVIRSKILEQIRIENLGVIYLSGCNLNRVTFIGNPYFSIHHQNAAFRCLEVMLGRHKERSQISSESVDCLNSRLFFLLVELDSYLRRLGFWDLPWPMPRHVF